MVTAAMKLKDTCFLKKSYDQPAAAAAAAAKSLQSCPTLCDPHRRQPTRLPLSSILKSRDITLPTKVHLTKDMVFPVVMYGCESCTVKKAECQRIDAFELWCWRSLLTVSWTARRSNQFIPKEISPDCSMKGLMMKLTLILWPSDVKN